MIICFLYGLILLDIGSVSILRSGDLVADREVIN